MKIEEDLDFGSNVDEFGRYKWICQECGVTVMRKPPKKGPVKAIKCPSCHSEASLVIQGW